jgi:hypothetical protein
MQGINTSSLLKAAKKDTSQTFFAYFWRLLFFFLESILNMLGTIKKITMQTQIDHRNKI